MQYSEGQIGRVFVVRVDHGEDFLEEIREFIREKNIHTGIIHFLGAVNEATLVTGPEEPVIPPVPHTEEVQGGWEILGFATVYPGADGPGIHLHATAGRQDRALTGCLRDRAVAYLIVEAVIIEFTGLTARKELDGRTGLHLPFFGGV